MLLGRGAMQHAQQLLQRKSCIEFPTNSSLKLIVADAFAATLLISGNLWIVVITAQMAAVLADRSDCHHDLGTHALLVGLCYYSVATTSG